MNKENAHLFLPLVQALADGKIIQRKLPHCKFMGTNLDGTTYLVDSLEEWVDCTVDVFAFANAPEYYRIKPEEPRTFMILKHKHSGQCCQDIQDYDPTEEWERITVREVLE